MKKIFFINVTLVIVILLCNYVSLSHSLRPGTKAELGRQLFFDPVLSADSSVSCASCHKPAFAFADTQAVSPGIKGKKGDRNTPSLVNVYLRTALFYDGRSSDLAEQVKFPIENKNEMGLSVNALVDRLNQDGQYRSQFLRLYPDGVSIQNIGHAIGEYEKTLVGSNSSFDDHLLGLNGSLSASAERGRKLFMSPKAKCFTCHYTNEFTGDDFANIGLYNGREYNDQGRSSVTGKIEDLGKFKVPSLRNIAVTAPYMHDGSFRTLSEVIDYYNNPGKFVKDPVNADPGVLTPIGLNEQEKQDLIEFLISLTDSKYMYLTRIPLNKTK